MSSAKQGSGAMVLREGRDIVTRKTFVPAFSNLGKAAELQLAFSFSSAAGAVPNPSLQII
jgi:hypothetical protein